jgi:hypothetical protein
MHQNYDHMEEINLVDLYQEEIDFLNQQNGSLEESTDPIDQRQYWKNQIVIEYFKKRIDEELDLQNQFKARQQSRTIN